jgi:hypothetical protein
VLKLSKEKWDEAAAHAMQAVQPDFRKRVWYPPGHNMGIGILFNCKYGAVCLKESVALLQVRSSRGAGGGASVQGSWVCMLKPPCTPWHVCTCQLAQHPCAAMQLNLMQHALSA